MNNDQLRLKKKIIKIVLTQLKDAGFYAIKSWTDGYESPEEITISKKETTVADISAKFEKKPFLFEVELSKKSKVAKWKALSNHVKKYSGKLFIVIPYDLIFTVNKQLRKNDIDAEIVELAV